MLVVMRFLRPEDFMDTSEPVNNLESHVLHHQEEEEEEVQDKEEVGEIFFKSPKSECVTASFNGCDSN